MFRHTLCLLVLATVAACSKEEPGYDPPALADRTVLLYMPGRDLEEKGNYFSKNIRGVSQAVNDRALGNGRMLVCWQPENQTSAVMQELYYDRNKRRCETVTLCSYDQFDAGSVTDVERLFADAARLAPARGYGLIIGCHGKAWVPASSGKLPRSMLPDDDVWRKAPGTEKTRSFGDSGHELDITELAAALEAQRFRFDYLIFDDCFMANIETLYDLRRAVDYIVASPCEVMGDGFPYDRIVPHLFEENGVMSSLKKTCWEFWNLYQNDYESTTWKEQSGCISLAVMSELDALAAQMRRVNQNGKQPFDITMLQIYKGGSTPLFYDLGHYVLNSCGDTTLIGDFNAALNRAFPPDCRLHTAKFYSDYNKRLNPVFFYTGVSVSEPSEVFAEENRQTSWYRDTH